MLSLTEHTEEINRLMARYGVKFGIYNNNQFNERLFPFDTVPRIIQKSEFEYLEKGLKQRAKALNLFLNDIYSKKQIIKDKIIPEDFAYTSTGFLPACEGIVPSKSIYNHISGIDLVEGKDGNWYVIEDNLRIPSGASYPMIARELCRRASPDTFQQNLIVDNRSYGNMLKDVFDYVNAGGITVILTPGRYNSAFFEHSYLAEKTGAVFAMPQDLFVEGNVLYYNEYSGKNRRVGCVYRRISDEYLDPMTFVPESIIGVPHIMDSYRAGNVAIVNAPGNGVADDKGIYYFVPKIINYYLGETPILKNAPTYIPYYENDMKYTIDNLEKLVIKDVSEAGGYGVVFGCNLTQNELADFKIRIKENPRRFITQEVIDFKELSAYENGKEVLKRADLRAFVLYGEEIKVWQSGLTRYSQNPNSYIVNSSQGGGFKDTWVLSR
ncbi:MAG: circularly permuted type 2 ATP-grasp protein [Oscillospiraceae bacterium]